MFILKIFGIGIQKKFRLIFKIKFKFNWYFLFSRSKDFKLHEFSEKNA